MLSLIIALASPTLASGEIRYALAQGAAPGLRRADADNGADSAMAEHGSAPLALLPRADEVVAVVPARMLSWHRITLPKVNSARLRSALEGILEERLLDEPQNLHFALAPVAAPGSSVWVAACDRAWLQAALQTLEAAGRTVVRVVPEYAPLPAGSSTTLHVTGSPDNAWLVRCAEDGVQTLPLGPAVHAALGLDGTEEPAMAEPAVAALAEQVLGRKVQVGHSAQGLVDAARSDWNLAQFELASNGHTRLARRAGQAWTQWAESAAWRPARWGLAALVAAHLLGLNAWAWKERSSLQAKREDVRALLLQTFPKVPVVVDAPLQMAREVAVLRQATGAVSNRDLEPMLAAVAQNTPTAPSPSTIEFAANQLTLKGFQPPPAAASALTQGLAAAGYASQIDGDAWVIKAAADIDGGISRGARP